MTPTLDKIDYLFEQITLFCNSFTSSQIQTDCLNSLSALSSLNKVNIRKFSSISYLITNNPNPRSKRGLFDIGGSLLKTFFGTLTSDDAAKFTEAIDKVQSDENHLTYLMRDNIHIIKSTISSFNNTMCKVTENEKRLAQNMESIQIAMGTINDSTNKLQVKTQIASLLNSLEAIITSVSFDIDDVNNAILFAKLNVLHPTVLSPHQLFSELDRHRNYLPKHYELPVSLSLQNINELIDVSQLVCYYHANKVVIVVKIPLVLPQTYELYNVIPLPIPYDSSKPDTFALIAPTSSHVAITADHMFYSLIDDLSKCKVITEKCYVCVLANIYSTIANPTCETTLITDIVTKIPDSCNVKLLHGSVDLFHKITYNRWIFVQSVPGKCHITCESSLHDEMLFATGILSLPKGCKAFFRTLQLSSTDTHTINATYTHSIGNFNIIDDCINKNRIKNTTFNKIPISKLDNINNMDNLVHASMHLTQLENELNKLESPTHLQKYSMHYMSLSYIMSIIFLLYLLFRSRKLLCQSKSPSCCIQIYNQCNNKKSKATSPLSISMQSCTSTDAADCAEVEHPTPQKRNVIISRSQPHDE